MVRNKAAPVGSIAEGYIADELLIFCSRYLVNAPTIHNKPYRNLDESRGAVIRFTVDVLTMNQVHRYIIFNFNDFFQLRR
jgi:hypothetical protein